MHGDARGAAPISALSCVWTWPRRATRRWPSRVRELFAAGEALDDLPHYRVGDLIGLRVETASGRHLGEVADVVESPAHEILDIRTPDGGSQLVPLVDELVSVDHEAGLLRVVDGLLDEPGQA